MSEMHTKKKGGRGTHGSISKAGKVRQQTPKIPPSVKHNKKSFPRYRNRRNYEKRELLRCKSGQNYLRD